MDSQIEKLSASSYTFFFSYHVKDQKDYPKAPQDSYFKLAANLDNAGFDAISIEDAHRRNNLSLFSQFKKTKVSLAFYLSIHNLIYFLSGG